MRRMLALALVGVLTSPVNAAPPAPEPVLTGQAAFGDWRDDHPGVRRKITPGDLPKPFATRSANNVATDEESPPGALPKVPQGFSVARFATGLQGPRLVRVAPNGDIFVAETDANRIRVLRAADGAAKADTVAVFAKELDMPFGISFYPPGSDPKWVYVANTNSVLRFPYESGDLEARGKPETIVRQLALSTGGHTTRDIQFDRDGKRMFVSVGSASNVAEAMPERDPRQAKRWQESHPLGAAWGDESSRADVLAFDSDGKNQQVYATGIRNCVGLAVHPSTGDLWCSTNERDGLGDNLVPDYVTRVRAGAWYGWPWYYIGDHEDPRQKGRRPDLIGKATVPDVLLQPHSASLQMTFYDPPAAATSIFPQAYRRDGFAALHGSWNRGKRTGYKVVRILLKDGVPTGEYEDFLTGFVLPGDRVWGRPVGVAVAHDGALIVSEDANGTLWKITATGKRVDR